MNSMNERQMAGRLICLSSPLLRNADEHLVSKSRKWFCWTVGSTLSFLDIFASLPQNTLKRFQTFYHFHCKTEVELQEVNPYKV